MDPIDLFHINSGTLITQISSIVENIDQYKDKYEQILSKHLNNEDVVVNNLLASYHPMYNTDVVTSIRYTSDVGVELRLEKLNRINVLNRLNSHHLLLYFYIEEYDVIYELIYDSTMPHITSEIKEKHRQIVIDRLSNKSS